MAGVTTEQVIKSIEIDFNNKLVESLEPVLEVLSIGTLEVIPAGSVIKQYKITGTLQNGEVTEGEDVPESTYKQEAVRTIEAKILKYRKPTTEEAILKSGLDVAVAKTDEKFHGDIANVIRKNFTDFVKAGTGTADSGKDLKGALARVAGKLTAEAMDKGYQGTTPIFFVNPADVYEYLGDSNIYHTETAFGMKYINDFLGLGTVVFSDVEAGSVYGTFVENINGYAVDLAALNSAGFDYTIDETGVIGIAHEGWKKNGTVYTDVRTGVQFVPEYVNLIFKSEIVPEVD